MRPPAVSSSRFRRARLALRLAFLHPSRFAYARSVSRVGLAGDKHASHLLAVSLGLRIEPRKGTGEPLAVHHEVRAHVGAHRVPFGANRSLHRRDASRRQHLGITMATAGAGLIALYLL